MIFLFVHQNFPGQYKNIVRYLSQQPEHKVYFLTQKNKNWIGNVTKLVYDPQHPESVSCHPYTVDFDLAVRTGLAVINTCEALRQAGVRPDVIIGHSGWGEMMFLKDAFPDSPVLSYFEFFYHYHSVDVNFDREYPSAPSEAYRLRIKNSVNLVTADATDWGNAPTQWQRSLYPPEIRSRISVIHEGIDTEKARPDPTAWVELVKDGLTLRPSDEVVTYIARNLEPYRGFPSFMRAVAEIQRRRPKTQIIVLGGDGVSYGAPAPAGETYRNLLLKELDGKIDLTRIHFLGKVAYETYLSVLRISSAHIYLTYPFVLSWSFLEAMATGCAVIGSRTPPVLEVLKDGVNGLSADFFSPTEIADRVDQILDHPDRMQDMRKRAREFVIEHYDFTSLILPRWLGLIDDLINGRRPKTY